MKAKNQKLTKIYYSMGEVAEMFDVNTTLIRFWESKFDVLKPHRNKKGNRLFTPEDVETLKLIYHLVKEKGMTLAGAQKRIKENREGVERNMEIIEKLQNIRSVLLEIRQEMKGGEGNDTILVDDDAEDYGAAGFDPVDDMDAVTIRETSDVGAAIEEAFHLDAAPEPTIDAQFEETNATVSAEEERVEQLAERTVGGIAAGDTVAAGAACELPAEATGHGDAMLQGKDDSVLTESGEAPKGDSPVEEVQRPKIVEQTLF